MHSSPVLSVPALLLAAASLGTNPPEPEPQIFNGESVSACGWPSVVNISSGSCTGVLVHPQIVLTAAHCVDNAVASPIRFGETVSSDIELSATEYCRQGPDWTGATAQGTDYAYCKLSTPVTSIPIIPVAAGCEQTAIVTGARIMHVGFGVTELGSGGKKNMLDTEIDALTFNGELISGDDDHIICNGDSGGPTFVYLDPELGGDGTWRVAAIHSWAQGADPADPNCFGQAGSTLVSQAIDWVEQDSGIDITPCTSGDEWDPTFYCDGLPTSPWLGEGAYTVGCSNPDVVEQSAICGPALAADNIAPTVSIVTPTPLEQIDGEGNTVAVDVEIQAADEGWGVGAVELHVREVGSDNEQIDTRDEWMSWTWKLALPPGSYEIEVIALDHAGNASEPATVCFGVDELACEAEGSEGDTGGGSEGADSTGDATGDAPGESGDAEEETGDVDDTEGPGADQESGGCGCRTTDTRSAWLSLGLVLVGLRRRRARLTSTAR